ncbi:MAG: glycosyltransferase [Candidatus Rokubacteria bacterium]|nr:glycosyltransferase [Candidatus Rokubacteria bacterium]
MTPRGGRLVVVPSDAIADYERAGYDWLERYYNPGGFFREVYALSPREHGQRRAHGMTVLGVAERDFATALTRLTPDVVRAYGGGWAAELVCRERLPGVPVVVSVHSTHPPAVRRVIRYADLVLCVSHVVAERARAVGASAERIRILPNRVDTTVFHPGAGGALRRQLDARFGQGKHVLHVGRKSEQKNQDTVIRALRHLPADYSIIFVGQGDDGSYRRLAETLCVGERCHWVDTVPNRELAAWYAWCDCMCTPSRWEGFGIVFIEAAACGARIVTSDIAPMNEYLTHDVNACLVREFENPEAIAAAIRRVCEDARHAGTLAAGAVVAARPFERDHVDAAEVAIYDEALGLRGRCHGPLSLGERLDLDARVAGEQAVAAVRTIVPSPLVRLAKRILRPPRRPTSGGSAPERALAWLRAHEARDGGILVHSVHERAYQEVTGYLVPTLLAHGERALAERCVRWLVRIQRADGGYAAPDGTPFVFDTAQALRGLLAATSLVEDAAAAAARAADYLCAQAVDGGRGGFGPRYSDGIIPEPIHLYALPPLQAAAQALRTPRYATVADAALTYYRHHPALLALSTLTHFLAYEIEALIDLGHAGTAAPALDALRAEQAADGGVRALPEAAWVCTPGLAQLAVCWAKTGQRAAAARARAWLEARQEASGGFRGSYGAGATYFPDVEPAWAVKYYLDAHALSC